MKRTIGAFIGSVILCCCVTATYAQKPVASHTMPPTIVTLTTVAQKPYKNSIQEIGSLSSINGSTLKAETSGRVTDIFFQSGQMVKKDQPLVQIFPDVLKAQLQQAKAQLTLAQISYERFLDLSKKSFVSKADLDKAKAAQDESQANVDSIKAQLSQNLITAPFDGKIGLRQVSVGDFLSPGSPIVDIESLDPLRADFSLPEVYLSQIHVNDKITMTSRAFPNKAIEGKIYALNSSVDPSTRSLDIRALVPNKDLQLLPGIFVEVTVYLGQSENVLVIPQTAVSYAEDGPYVYKNIDNKAVLTKIDLGEKLENNLVIVNKGLKLGETMVAEGQLKLFDGAPITTEIKKG